MNKTMIVALALAMSAGSTVAFADGSPELNRPFGNGGYVRAPSVATNQEAGPVTNDLDARARLQADGYRAIDGLARGNDGAWHGTAIRGAAKVNVTVSGDGRILAQ